MDKSAIVGAFLAVSVVCAVISGIIANRKGDFFSRGAAIGALTAVFGLVFLIMAPPSKAAAGDAHDLQNWHVHSASGGWLYLGAILLGVVYLYIL
jgi:hypothetical protein